ncbi:MAG: nitrate reductase molybdenum cofactor assembly chaperone [Pelagibacterales bacterium]|jgi:nitrate reductase delta subunit|nr:nitrate reductase molybdenum cofactor assembly chaperone [Pelagibacterales bacterium]
MKTFKILGLLLTYPRSETIEHFDEMSSALEAEKILPSKNLKLVSGFLDKLKTADLLDLQEEYVETFDRSRSCCLNLFEHVHGESRDRGQAMVDLAEMYHEKKLFIDSKELPDFLPVFLEYLSLCTASEATELLDDMAHIVATIGAKLKKSKNDYHIIFAAIEKLSTVKIDSKIIENALAELAAEDNSLEALDKEWEEAAAFTGDAAEDCKTCNAFPNATESLQQMTEGSQ